MLAEAPTPVTPVTGAVRSWSHSKLVDFDKCKKLTWLKHVKRIPEPERELPEGKTEFANDRGTRVHEALEAYCRGTTEEYPHEARHFRTEADKLRRMFTLGMVSFEGEWGMDRGWNPTDWKTAWLRLKLDALAHISEYEAVAIDYKTGKLWGNEIKHGEQVNLYALCSFLRYPKLEVVHTELWYLDLDEMTQRTMKRDQALRFLKGFDMRGNKLTTCLDFPASPSRPTCRWCPYLNTEHCAEGVA